VALVYSTRFLEARGLGSSPHVYTCPTGYRAVVRGAQFYANAILQSEAWLRGASGQVVAAGLAGSLTRFFISWDLHYVFDEGEHIEILTDGGDWDVSVSGYLLTL
jgi:hypothetical protein